MKSLLGSVGRLPPERAAAVLAHFGGEAARAVEESTGLEWLPLGDNVRLTRAVHEALEQEACDRFFRAQLLQSFEGPLFRALADGAIHLFGLDPMSWARLVPSGWGLVFRDCGRWDVAHAAPGEVLLTLADVPPACTVDAVWPRSVAASLSAIVDLAQARGEATLAGFEPGAPAMRVALRWSARAG
jgi:hypothetical protein